MSSSYSLIQCPNPDCLYAENLLGRPLCDRCQTPLVYRYLWAVGVGADQIPSGTVVGDRYNVIAPRVWLDTQPASSPHTLPDLPDIALPYLRLFPQRLHIPVVYGFVQPAGGSPAIMLLENVPLDDRGQFFPSLQLAWARTAAVRQVYWLWQILQLWASLSEVNAVASLLVPDNLRVEGWRVRLRELLLNHQQVDGEEPLDPSFKTFVKVWLGLTEQAQPPVFKPLKDIFYQMQMAEDSASGLAAILGSLNQLLLAQAAQLPLRLQIAGATTSGPQRTHNEDACYPITVGAPPQSHDPLVPNLAIVCDGIGGHAGGEVASQLAVRSFQLQVLALLAEVTEQPDLTSPDVVTEQLQAIVRVVNNLIAERNNQQGRESRQRMGTTLVMALQLPQTLSTPMGAGNTHELYLIHLGDSRAYWLTPHYCHLLTVDDDVASREVRMGRSLYWEAQKRPDAGALTQAIGTRDSDAIDPTVQRFIIEEDGLLLLCSDGLSDGDRVEQTWRDLTPSVFKSELSLEAATEFLINLANEQSGHDNTSVVMIQCQVSPDYPQVYEPEMTLIPIERPEETELSESARALLYDEPLPETDSAPVETNLEPAKQPQPISKWAVMLGLAVLMFFLGALGITIWRQLDPIGFQQTIQQLLEINDEE
jgi:protein phosphatase